MKKILLLFIATCNIFVLYSQDYHLSQYFNSSFVINPAYTGLFDGANRFSMCYKNQWAGIIQSPYRTFGLSFDSKLLHNQTETGVLSIGFSLMKDKAGSFDLSETHILSSVSYIQKLSENSWLSAAIQGGILQKTINHTEEVWNSIYNSQNNTGATFPVNSNLLHLQYSHIDFAGGVVYNFSNSGDMIAWNQGFSFDIGASFHHVTSAKKTFTEDFVQKRYIKFNIHAKSDVPIYGSSFALLPSFLYSRHGPHSEFISGSGLRYMTTENQLENRRDKRAMILGVYYRLKDAIIVYSGIEFSDYFLGLTYDIGVGKLGNAVKNVNSLEISLRYVMQDKRNK